MPIQQISVEEYNELRAVRQSTLKYIGQSPLHFKHAAENFGAGKKSKALTVGDAAHVAILEPTRFQSQFVVWPGYTMKSGELSTAKRGKEWEEFKKENASRSILSTKERELVINIKRAVHGNKIAMRHLVDGKPEMTLTWVDPKSGMACKARADWLGKTMVGLKTARHIDQRRFAVDCIARGYGLQWAFYERGYKEITGTTIPLVEVVVENQPPYDVAVYQVNDEWLDLGREKIDGYLALLKDCLEKNQWPGQYPVGEMDLPIPAWAADITPGDDPEIDFTGSEE